MRVWRLCVNSHAGRLHEFCLTKLYSFIADIDRRHQLAILRSLKQNYRMDTLIPFHGTTHISEAVLELPLSDGEAAGENCIER